MLGLEVLERSLDDQVGTGGGQIVEGRRLVESREPFVDPGRGRIRIEVEPGGAPFEAAPDPCPATLDGGRVDVVHPDGMTRLERELRDPGAHRAGAHHADRVATVDHGQTGLMASNGCRQSVQ